MSIDEKGTCSTHTKEKEKSGMLSGRRKRKSPTTDV